MAMNDNAKDDPKPPLDQTSDANRGSEHDFAELSALIKADLPETSASEEDDALLEATLSELQPSLPPEPIARPKKPRSRLKRFALLLFLLALALAASFWWLRSSFHQPVTFNADQVITIKQGANTQSIIEQLHKIGVV